MYSFMRIESKKDRLQIFAFVLIYSFTCLTSHGNWFQIGYLLNNLVLLGISVVPIFVPENYKVFYLFGYACAFSSWIDSLLVPFSLIFERHHLTTIFQKISFVSAIISAVMFMILKYIICISEVQIARYLNNQPELKFRYKIDLFNYTRGANNRGAFGNKSSVRSRVGNEDVTVSLTQISANTTQVNQTSELISQTINNELKFEKNHDIEKHLVPH